MKERIETTEGGKKPRKWIRAVSSDLPASVLQYKKRYCGLCKTRMDWKEEMDAWLCRNPKCTAILHRGYGIGPTKEDMLLVTATDPYAEHNLSFVQTIDPYRRDREKKPEGYHNLRRPAEEKKAKSAAEAVGTW